MTCLLLLLPYRIADAYLPTREGFDMISLFGTYSDAIRTNPYPIDVFSDGWNARFIKCLYNFTHFTTLKPLLLLSDFKCLVTC